MKIESNYQYYDVEVFHEGNPQYIVTLCERFSRGM